MRSDRNQIRKVQKISRLANYTNLFRVLSKFCSTFLQYFFSKIYYFFSAYLDKSKTHSSSHDNNDSRIVSLLYYNDIAVLQRSCTMYGPAVSQLHYVKRQFLKQFWHISVCLVKLCLQYTKNALLSYYIIVYEEDIMRTLNYVYSLRRTGYRIHIGQCRPLAQFTPPIYAHRCVQHLLSERLTSLGIMGVPRVPPLNPSETIVL